MKYINTIFKRLGIIIFVLLLGFVFIACDSNSPRDDTPPSIDIPNDNQNDDKPSINLPTSFPTIFIGHNEITVKVGDEVALLNGVSAIGYYNDDLTSDIKVIHSIPVSNNKYTESGRYEVTYHLIIKGQIAAIETKIVVVTSDVVETPDTTKPVITITGKSSYVVGEEIDLSKCASATDDKDSNVVCEIVESESILPKLDGNKLNEVGNFKVVYKAVDSSGNEVRQVYQFSVEAKVEKDTIKPTIDVIGKSTYIVNDVIDYYSCIIVTDNMDSNPSVSIVESESNLPLLNGNKLNEIGSFKVVFKAVDKSGNETKATYEFTVEDISSLGENLIKNADFSNTTKESQGFGGWLVLADTSSLKLNYTIEESKVILTVNNYTATQNWHNQFKQTNLSIERGQHYTLKITLSSSIKRDVVIGVQNDTSWEFHLNKQVSINETPQDFSFDFYGTSNNSNVIFFVGLGNVNGVSASDHNVTISGLGLYKTKANTVSDVSIPEGYKLVWSDEFNGTGAVDSSKWQHELGGHGWGNNELQYYTNSEKNSYQKDGALHIAAIKENYGGRNYTSARLITKNLAEFKYGIVEAKIQLPSGGGVWPAFWMLGTNINSVNWPNCGEIDIMEGRGNIPDVILGTIHCGAYNHSIGTQKGSELFVPNSETTYNIYRLEWTENKIVISVNGNEYFHFEKPVNASFNEWPFSENFYIILNVAMGGMFGGSVEANFTKSEMLVDYVRVYQKN